MNVLIVISLTVVALVGSAVVASGVPERQAVSLSVFGLALTMLFVVLQAPDVALSQLGIGAAVVPLMVMLAARRIHRDQERNGREEGSREQGGQEQGSQKRGGRSDGEAAG